MLAVCLLTFRQFTVSKRNRQNSESSACENKTESLMASSQTPVLNDVRDVTLCQSPRNGGLVALVSYENKVRQVLHQQTH